MKFSPAILALLLLAGCGHPRNQPTEPASPTNTETTPAYSPPVKASILPFQWPRTKWQKGDADEMARSAGFLLAYDKNAQFQAILDSYKTETGCFAGYLFGVFENTPEGHAKEEESRQNRIDTFKDQLTEYASSQTKLPTSAQWPNHFLGVIIGIDCEGNLSGT